MRKLSVPLLSLSAGLLLLLGLISTMCIAAVTAACPMVFAASLPPESAPSSAAQTQQGAVSSAVPQTPATGSSTVVFQLESAPQTQQTVESVPGRWNILGFVSWGVIALGVAIVVVVILCAARRPGNGSIARTRYRRKKDADTHARRMLDDNRYRKY